MAGCIKAIESQSYLLRHISQALTIGYDVVTVSLDN